MVAWWIRKSRNDAIFDNGGISGEQLVIQAQSWLQDFAVSVLPITTGTGFAAPQAQQTHWCPPPSFLFIKVEHRRCM